MQHKVITSANLCKPIHDIINYSAFICPFEFEECGMEGNKLQKFEYLKNEKSIFRFLKRYQLMKMYLNVPYGPIRNKSTIFT